MPGLSVFWDDRFLEHEPPDGEFEAEWTGRLAVREPHPDRPERLRNVRHVLDHELEDVLTWRQAPEVTDEQLHRVHDREYVEDLQTFCTSGGGRLTAATGANEATYEAARYAAGAAVAAVEHAVGGGYDGFAPNDSGAAADRSGAAADDSTDVPYACVRPSGHHAQPAQADGFCFFNNAAIAVEEALRSEDVERVVVIDWDVHHGNGTQEIFYDRDDVCFVDLHMDHEAWDPVSHPQTGTVDEHGTGDGTGYTVNVPLPAGTGDAGYADAFDRLVEPIVGEFDPHLIVVSAGADAGTIDPLGRNVVTKAGFEELGRRVRSLAESRADGRLALVQEGGYQITHLAYATLGTMEGVLGIDSTVEDPFDYIGEDAESTQRRIDDLVEYFDRFWDFE